MVLTKERREYIKNYMKKWRKKNKELNKKLNKNYSKKYYNKNVEKIKKKARLKSKLIYHCLFCNKTLHFSHKKRHNRTKIHKNNILKFNKILKKYKLNLKKI